MQAVEGARGYEQLREAAIVRDGISYVGLDDLIAMKHAAGRDLDHIDIRALEEARGPRAEVGTRPRRSRNGDSHR
jgi:hypothetical protein